MFDAEFFPTPAWVVQKMFDPYLELVDKRYTRGEKLRTILEPSAGKGDILDWIIKQYGASLSDAIGFYQRGYSGPRLEAIEQNPDLVAVLQKKEYRVVATDFLTYTPEIPPDLILMNPPFSAGARHLLHAWEILNGGDVVCLLNAETIRNPFSEERRLLGRVIKDAAGTIEFLGQAFQGSERSTSVEIAMVRMHKPKSDDSISFEFTPPAGESDEMPKLEVGSTGSELIKPDQVGAFIRCYDKAKESFVNYIQARDQLDFYCRGITKARGSDIADEARASSGGGNPSGAYDNFRDGLRLQFWTYILETIGIEKLLTSKLRQKFSQFIEQQSAMALTKENISNVVQTLILNSDGIMKQAVVTVFDMFTKYHKDNRIHPEGWKTNGKWQANKKVIIPNFVEYDYGKFHYRYGRYSEYDDIDKAMCYLAGKRFEDILTIKDAINPLEKDSESEFFKMRYFQKGTMHLTFKDESLWAKFNQVAVDGRNWLPDLTECENV